MVVRAAPSRRTRSNIAWMVGTSCAVTTVVMGRPTICALVMPSIHSTVSLTSRQTPWMLAISTRSASVCGTDGQDGTGPDPRGSDGKLDIVRCIDLMGQALNGPG